MRSHALQNRVIGDDGDEGSVAEEEEQQQRRQREQEDCSDGPQAGRPAFLRPR